MKKNTKQIIALAISVVMIIGMFPMIALAEWVADENTPPVELPEGQTPVENDENARWEVVGSYEVDGDVVIGYEDGDIIDTVQEYVYQDVTDENGETVQERVRDFVGYENVYVVDEEGNVVNDEDGQPKRAQEHKRVAEDAELEEGQVRDDDGYVFTQETVFVYLEDEDGNVMLDENDQPIREQVRIGFVQVPGRPAGETARPDIVDDSGNSGAFPGTPENGLKIGSDNLSSEIREKGIQIRSVNSDADTLRVPAGITVTLRIQNSSGYTFRDVSGPIDFTLPGNNQWIHDVQSNMIDDETRPIYGDLTRVVDHPVLINSMREVWEDRMRDVNLYEQLPLFNQITIQIFQRFLWVEPIIEEDPPIIEEEDDPPIIGDEDPPIIGDEDDDPIFFDTETGEILTLEEVVALFVPPVVPADDEEETVEIATPAVPLAPAPAEAADEDFVEIETPAVPLAAPEAPGIHIWLLTLLIFPLLVLGWIIRQKTKKEESYE